MRFRSTITCVSAAALALSGCGGGGGNGGSITPVVTPPPPPPTGPVRVFSDPPPESLSTAEVQQVIAQAVAEAQARNKGAAIVVVDRVGNPLAAFRMNNAPSALTIPNVPTPVARTLPGLNLPFAAAPVGAALAKAVTGAYLSSAGNAFSTRTASQIVQEHFPPSPAAVGLESGPLYGVQFSSLPCSDLVARFNSGSGSGSLFVNPATGAPTATAAGMIGPRRTPLGLAADSGGFPLYKNGTLVGGVGVLSDGVYSFDANILDVDNDDDEFIALAATRNFDAPDAIRANRPSHRSMAASDRCSPFPATRPIPFPASLQAVLTAPKRRVSANRRLQIMPIVTSMCCPMAAGITVSQSVLRPTVRSRRNR
jgi:uncharacterized protein GlcG (DUF336 family)